MAQLTIPEKKALNEVQKLIEDSGLPRLHQMLSGLYFEYTQLIAKGEENWHPDHHDQLYYLSEFIKAVNIHHKD